MTGPPYAKGQNFGHIRERQAQALQNWQCAAQEVLLHACHGRHEIQSGRLCIPTPPQRERQKRQGHRLRSYEKISAYRLWRLKDRKAL